MSVPRYVFHPVSRAVVAPSEDDELPSLTDQHHQPPPEDERPLPAADDYLDPWAKPKPAAKGYETPDPDPNNPIPRFLREDVETPPPTTRQFGWRPPKPRGKRS